MLKLILNLYKRRLNFPLKDSTIPIFLLKNILKSLWYVTNTKLHSNLNFNILNKRIHSRRFQSKLQNQIIYLLIKSLYNSTRQYYARTLHSSNYYQFNSEIEIVQSYNFSMYFTTCINCISNKTIKKNKT